MVPFVILSLKSTPLLIGWLAVWMFGVTMATVRTILMLWGAIDDSKVDEEFDWTMPVVGSVIYVVFGGTNAVQEWAKFLFPGLVNFVPTVAYHFCLA